MANVMSMQKVNNRPSRSAFDLSRKNLFTAKVGEILPVVVLECLPGDKHRIETKWLTRTQPLDTAAYTRVREYFNWYYVPTNLLWNKFDDFVVNMVDNNMKADSINVASKLSEQHPYVTCSQIWSYIYNIAQQDKKNFFGFSRAKLTCKLLEYLGYGDFYQATITSEFPRDRINAVLNIFPLLAYQKIYQDHIRNSQWEKAYAPASNINYMTGVAGSNNIPINNIDIDVENMFDLRYSDWNKDYFMGVLPNQQYGPASIIPVNDTTPGIYVDGNIGLPTSSGQYGNVTVSAGAVNAQLNGTDINLRLTSSQLKSFRDSLSIQFGVLALRQAEAVQKMREIQQSHEQDYKSQLEARFNVKPSDAYSDRCKWLGGDSASIDISEVVNTNLSSTSAGITSDSNAVIKGKGVGTGTGKIEFETSVHGYLVCLYHAVPLLDFAISGIKKQNLKTLFTDYAQPELDKTGMVSIPLIELINNDMPVGFAQNRNLIGYAPQYYEYKTAYDECHGAFNKTDTNNGLPSWVAPIGNQYLSNYLNSLDFSQYVEGFNYMFFKVPPSILNNIMAVNADSTPDTDQLLVNSYYQIYSVRNLDYNGLPY